MTDPMISVRGLWKVYGHRAERIVGSPLADMPRGELEASDNPKALLKDITERLNRVRSPFRTAEKFGIEDIIDPRDTRPVLCEFVEAAYRILEPGPVAKGWRC